MKICLSCCHNFNLKTWKCPNCGYYPEVKNDIVSFHSEIEEQIDGFNIDFFEELFKVENNNFWFRNRNRLIVWALKTSFKDVGNFMEIGCGTGFVLSGVENAFSRLTLYGSEVFSKGLEFAQRRVRNVDFFQFDARHIPFKNEFDVIGAFDVLEHIQEDGLVLRQMYQATTSYGGIILTVPQHPWMWSQEDEYARHVRRYRATEIKNKVESVGFHVVKITSFVSLLFPLMVLNRLKQRKKNEFYDPMSEFKISRAANFLFESVLGIELNMIKAGVRFPVGGSLLVIAKK